MAKTNLGQQWLGVIRPESVYRLNEAGRRAGLGKAGLRKARQNGLIVRYYGRTAFVFGRDLIRFLDENATFEKPGFESNERWGTK